MREDRVTQEEIHKILKEHRIVTIDDIAQTCKCSRNTVFLKLKGLDCVTSYNQNKRYQTLHDTLLFDENGLCTINNACFSKWGGVKKTILALVENSTKGLSTGQINHIMRIRTNRQLGELVRTGRIVRHQRGRNQYYFSAKPATQHKQMQNAQKCWTEEEKTGALPPTEVIIQMLVTMINEHETDPVRVQQLLKVEGIRLSIKVIEHVFTKYKLKKTTFH